MKETYKDFIGIYENAFPKEYCDFIITTFKKHQDASIERLIINGENESQDKSINLKDHLDDNSINVFFNCMKGITKQYINKYRQLVVETRGGYNIADFKVQQTKPSEGYHVWHSEFDPSPINCNRWGVWALYLNDVEEGGETEFLYQSVRVKPKTGTVCLFPAYYTHTHRGNPPLKGTKYIITGWLTYPENYIKDITQGYQDLYEQVKKTKSKINKNDS